MSGSSEFSSKMIVISNLHFVFIFLIKSTSTADMTGHAGVISFFVFYSKNHLLFGLKEIVVDILNVYFQPIDKYLRNVVLFALCCVKHQLPWINSIMKTFYVIAKRACNMFLILLGIALFWIRLAGVNVFSESFKIDICYYRNFIHVLKCSKLSFSPSFGRTSFTTSC